jgi:flavodoxin I
LGYEIIDEWYILGEFPAKQEHFNTNGRMGNITGRPNEADLKDVYERVIGILKV